VKSHKIADNSESSEARYEISIDVESLKILKKIYVGLIKVENYQILLDKISHRFLVTTS
jgi:hypothetical protein